MYRVFLGLSAVFVVGLFVVVAVANSASKTQRSDCPGKVICPLTGEEVCKDQCPAVAANRDDCPGKVTCPLTGEEVCKDRCPAGNANEKVDVDQKVRSCCQNK